MAHVVRPGPVRGPAILEVTGPTAGPMASDLRTIMVVVGCPRCRARLGAVQIVAFPGHEGDLVWSTMSFHPFPPIVLLGTSEDYWDGEAERWVEGIHEFGRPKSQTGARTTRTAGALGYVPGYWAPEANIVHCPRRGCGGFRTTLTTATMVDGLRAAVL